MKGSLLSLSWIWGFVQCREAPSLNQISFRTQFDAVLQHSWKIIRSLFVRSLINLSLIFGVGCIQSLLQCNDQNVNWGIMSSLVQCDKSQLFFGRILLLSRAIVGSFLLNVRSGTYGCSWNVAILQRDQISFSSFWMPEVIWLQLKRCYCRRIRFHFHYLLELRRRMGNRWSTHMLSWHEVLCLESFLEKFWVVNC